MQRLQITQQNRGHAGNGRKITLPSHIGVGGVENLALGGGLNLSISNYRLHETTRLEYVGFPAVLGFGFCLFGDIVSHPSGFKDAATIRSGQSALFHFNGASMWETMGAQRVIRINIMMAPLNFQNLLGKDSHRDFPELHQMLHQPQRIFDALTPAMRTILLQVLDCPYQGLSRDFFMEGKALELVACKLDQLGGEKPRLQGKAARKHQDVEKTRLAGQLITRDLENPPNFEELARQVGMCRSKLHQCFRDVFGLTPFDYLRHKRLETAERLLRQGELNVTETAYAVGYSSLSHFTKAFKQHVGYLPNTAKKKVSTVSSSRRRYVRRF